ncbi:MAG: class I SAM-dependent methyltransferase [Verrucomicrobia bacterium]|nr:class I SAM-dependent methyltransferase [Verrucomicrobiota bacterium]
MQTVKHKGSENTRENYKGIPIHSGRGVHQRIGEIMQQHLPPGSRVADLGAGDGALSLRLSDLGFEVVAFDLDTAGWRLKDVPCHQADLDRDLSALKSAGPFAAICAVEVIEHLENPRNFLRGIIQAGGDGSLLVITTPNPLDTFSCIAMFTRGIFNWFSRMHYASGGHISILPYWLIDEHLKFLGVRSQEWQFLSPYQHPVAWKQCVYRVLVRLRQMLVKDQASCGHEGQNAIAIVHL